MNTEISNASERNLNEKKCCIVKQLSVRKEGSMRWQKDSFVLFFWNSTLVYNQIIQDQGTIQQREGEAPPQEEYNYL